MVPNFLDTIMAIGYIAVVILLAGCYCCGKRRDAVNDTPPLPPAQPAPAHPVHAADLETGLPPPTAPDISLLEIAYTPHLCGQYLSQGVNVLITHQQYEDALSSALSSSVSEIYQEVIDRVLCTKCVICSAEFDAADACFVIGPCTHVFHRHCADSWLSSHMVCKVCRSHVNLGAVISFIP